MAPLNIQRLVAQPFGPYPDAQILAHAFPRRGSLPVLSALWMSCADAPIGFDESEFIATPPPASRVARHPVYIYGILVIDSLSWLSDLGREWLQLDFRQRDADIHMMHDLSGLTLEALYGHTKDEGSKISVWVHCEKNMLANFLTSDTLSDALIVHTREQNRKYRVRSLDVETYARSRNFLERFYLWSRIKTIIETDPHKTPVEHRTIDYLVDACLSRFRDNERFHRHIFDDSDSDVDDDGNTTLPRHLRHVSRSEMRSIFAAQADWILAYQLAPMGARQRLLNVKAWIAFCRSARKARRRARAQGHSWGMPFGASLDDELDQMDLSKFGETPEFWLNKLRLVATDSPTKAKRKKVNQRVISSPVSDDDPIFNEQAYLYDSDFSAASTPPASDSDSDLPPSDYMTLLKRAPSYCFQRPEIPDGRFTWLCPGCHYKIDLLNLTDENMEGLPPDSDAMRVLRGRSWRYLKEEPIQLAFYQMVSNHYNAHLRKLGMALVQKGSKQHLVKWPPDEQKKNDSTPALRRMSMRLRR